VDARAGRRPSKADLRAAIGSSVPDVLAEGLDLLFVGINPGLWSGAVGHHFARPGNRFWRALHRSGFTDRVLDPVEEATLPRYGIGITNLVDRATATAAELSSEDLRGGAEVLRAKVAAARPRAVAVLGIGAFRTAFLRPTAAFGRQPEPIGGSMLWVLPNPSGLNARYQVDELAERFAEVRAALA
jgi:TDG/mug DNA glycosylase family protein